MDSPRGAATGTSRRCTLTEAHTLEGTHSQSRTPTEAHTLTEACTQRCTNSQRLAPAEAQVPFRYRATWLEVHPRGCTCPGVVTGAHAEHTLPAAQTPSGAHTHARLCMSLSPYHPPLPGTASLTGWSVTQPIMHRQTPMSPPGVPVPGTFVACPFSNGVTPQKDIGGEGRAGGPGDPLPTWTAAALAKPVSWDSSETLGATRGLKRQEQRGR